MVVVGCGRVGSGLAVGLAQQGHSVAIIDKAPRAFRRLPGGWPGTTVVGSGFDRDDLDRAGAATADALAAVTSGDNSNILTARIARENYGIANVVARIYDPRRAEIYQRLGIPTVATVTWTIDQVLRRLLPETVTGEWTDATGQLVLVEHLLPEAWAGQAALRPRPRGPGQPGGRHPGRGAPPRRRRHGRPGRRRPPRGRDEGRHGRPRAPDRHRDPGDRACRRPRRRP